MRPYKLSWLVGLVLVFGTTGLLGCTSATLRLDPRAAHDETATIPAQGPVPVFLLMVLPPPGAGAASELSDLERALVRAGVHLSSSGMTGRVVIDDSGAWSAGDAHLSPLSELERALVLAKKVGADTLLEVNLLKWERSVRTFARTKTTFTELEAGIQADDGDLVRVQERVFHFQGRLIHVESGEVRAAFAIAQSTSRVKPLRRDISMRDQLEDIQTDTPERRQLAVSQALETFALHVIASRLAGSGH